MVFLCLIVTSNLLCLPLPCPIFHYCGLGSNLSVTSIGLIQELSMVRPPPLANCLFLSVTLYEDIIEYAECDYEEAFTSSLY